MPNDQKVDMSRKARYVWEPDDIVILESPSKKSVPDSSSKKSVNDTSKKSKPDGAVRKDTKP